jgi:hypothetical protein
MDRMQYKCVTEVDWQGHDRVSCQVDGRKGREAIPPRADNNARVATAEQAWVR